MTDRELLEFAAKAAGYKYTVEVCGDDCQVLVDGGLWNPLTDDGDAFRLAHAVPMIVTPGTARLLDGRLFGVDTNDTDATRRAIVMAAAEAGKEMK